VGFSPWRGVAVVSSPFESLPFLINDEHASVLAFHGQHAFAFGWRRRRQKIA
jgi:hypothetical protein